MKIKRFDNIWIMGLILSGTILVVLYVVKLLFPSFIIETAQNEKICLIGNYIDTHEWAWFLSSTVLSFVSYYFLCCACCRKTKLSLIELGIILVVIIIGHLTRKFLNSSYYTAINYISMIVLPCIMKAELKPTAIVFSSVNIVQVLTLEIRNIKAMVASFNFATLLILMIDVYMFEALLYFAFTYKK